ncbi:DUF551 domain-containing protein [Enterobacter roggenkampii]|uniref:DUF551 domain-containing protein n=1 Tax=Enterobacter roggenkampii TaxID=1812935 RepID=UPI001C5BCB49|nr:DUF551 domain-containing protein [Enterobacter roggenkampii]MBW4220652.1 DUF551 domain-containing protein [Enterobacter roggenkampii]
MSNIDKEWLKQKIADMEATRDDIPFGLDEDGSNTLAALRIALASLEAEAVAYIRSAHNPDGFCFADGIHPTHRHQRLPLSTLQDGCYWKVTPLYTAPPVPVAVPTFEEWCELTEQKPVGWVRDAMKEAYDGCRAVMIQGADGNSPVIPDGWVACSERLPDEIQPVITVSEGGVVQRTVYQFCEGVWSDWYDLYEDVSADSFTHWMPLPAAPQQEVKP